MKPIDRACVVTAWNRCRRSYRRVRSIRPPVRIFGTHQGECIGFAAIGTGPADLLVSYTGGLLREGRMETLWYVVADAALSADGVGSPGKVKKLNWWRTITTNADTFDRMP